MCHLGHVVNNIFKFGTLQISWSKSERSHSVSCLSHSLKALMTMKMVDLFLQL